MVISHATPSSSRNRSTRGVREPLHLPCGTLHTVLLGIKTSTGGADTHVHFLEHCRFAERAGRRRVEQSRHKSLRGYTGEFENPSSRLVAGRPRNLRAVDRSSVMG